MKKLKYLIIPLCIALLFSGCSKFRIASSIDDLISPVSPSGENAGVQNALDEYCKGAAYSIKIPAKGKYTTSFIFKNLSEGKEQAIAFYEMSSERGSVCMALITKENDKWNVVDNLKGEATDVSAVDFCDLNDDGTDEIIVCWSVVSKTKGFKADVYTQTDGDGKLKPLSDSVSASDFICLDLNGDGTNELLTFIGSSASDNAKAQLFSYKNNKKKLLGTTRLDSSISSYDSISHCKTDEGETVFADGIKSDGSSMVTEVIYWSDYYNSIVAPFYSYSTGKTKETTRSSLINSMDVDSDKVIEIPSGTSFEDLPSELSVQNWKEYSSTILIHKCYSVACQRDNYILLIPDKYFDSVSIKYNSDKREMTVSSKKGKQTAFSISTVIQSDYENDKSEYEGYTEIFNDSGFIYLAKVDKDSKLDITVKDLKKMIKAYN